MAHSFQFFILTLACIAIAVHSKTVVNIGYFLASYPFTVLIDRNYASWEDYEFHYYKQVVGTHVIAQLDAGALDISDIGSSPFAIGMARELDIQGIFVANVINENQALIVKKDLISNPKQLIGKRFGTVCGSTAHYHLLTFLDFCGISSQSVTIYCASIPDIKIMWEADQIDAAYSWGEGTTYTLTHGGYSLVPSGFMARWKRPTFIVVIGRKKFLQEHPRVVAHLLHVCKELNEHFLEALNIQEWSPNGTLFDSVVRVSEGVALANYSYPGYPYEVVPALQSTLMLTAEQQSDWFLPRGQLEQALNDTASFLHLYKSLYKPSTVDVSQYYNGTYFQMADDFSDPFPFETVQFPFQEDIPENACLDGSMTVLDSASGCLNTTGTVIFYNETWAEKTHKICKWRIIPGNDANAITHLTFEKFWMLSANLFDPADFLIMDQDGNLLLSMKERKMNISAEAPSIRVKGPVEIQGVFRPDGVPFVAYTNNGTQVSEQGFIVHYDSDICTDDTDCGGHGSCLGTGMCECELGYYGADCSFPYCIGTTFLTANAASFTDGASERYQNWAHCIWVIKPSNGEIPRLRFTEFDIEFGFDYVEVYDGEGDTKSLMYTFTGNAIPVEMYALNGTMTVRFASDQVAKRRGFIASYDTVVELVCSDASSCSNHGECRNNACFCDEGYFGDTCNLEICTAQTSLAGLGDAIIKPQKADTYSDVADANCRWTTSPPVSSVDGQAPTGARLDIEVFDLEPASADKVVIYDKNGGVLEELFMSAKQCSTFLDCPELSSGKCNNVTNQCVCKPGYFNSDCSLTSPRIYNTTTQISVKFQTDKGNPVGSSLGGVKLHYSAIYPCPFQCHGQGACVYGQCDCGPLFHGIYCESEIQPKFVDLAVVAAIEALLVLMLLYGLAITYVFFRYRHHITVKATNFTVTLSASLFLILLNIAGFVPLLKPTDFVCRLRWWGISIPLAGFLSCIFAKNWRLYQSLKRVSESLDPHKLITNKFLVGLITIVLLLFCVELAICTILTPISSQVVFDYENTSDVVVGCTGGKDFPYVIIPTFTLFLVCGVYICIQTKDMPAKYVDVKMMAICIYNTLFCGLILVPIDVLISGQGNAQAIVRSMGILIICFVGYSALVAAKVYKIKYPPSRQSIELAGLRQTSTLTRYGPNSEPQTRTSTSSTTTQ